MILLFGYWPPTDIGIATRHGMLWKWQTLQVNWKGSGYDVQAFSPTFQAPLPPIQPGKPPKWGQGTGILQVDYQKTSEDFWALVKQYRPIAILHHSRGADDNSWELEEKAHNLKHNDWVPDYTNPKRPNVGGAADDFSPYKNTPPPMAGDPPDPTQPAGSTRSSNLPKFQSNRSGGQPTAGGRFA